MKSRLTEENRQMFENIFGEGNINEENARAVEMMKQQNKQQTFIMNFVEKFFNFVSLITAKVVPFCYLFSIISNTKIESDDLMGTLKNILDLNLKQCFWVILSALIIWIGVEILRILVLLVINIVYTFEIRYRVKKVEALQEQVRQSLKKQDSKSKKNNDANINKSNLNRTEYSDEEIIKKAHELAKKYEENKISNKPHQ